MDYRIFKTYTSVQGLGHPCMLHVTFDHMQGNLAKQLAKLVKVKYVEDISLASRVGTSPCTWVPESCTLMPEMRTWVPELCTWISEFCTWVPDFCSNTERAFCVWGAIVCVPVLIVCCRTNLSPTVSLATIVPSQFRKLANHYDGVIAKSGLATRQHFNDFTGST